MDETYLTIAQLAERWDVTTQTLRNYRRESTGPQPIQLLPGRRGLRYRLSEVLAYENERKRAAGLSWRAPEVQP